MHSNREGRGFEPLNSHTKPYRNVRGSGVRTPQLPHEALQKCEAFFLHNNMFYTYILFSPGIDRFYIGCTSNIEERLKKHNNKNKGFTNQANDWCVVYSKTFSTKQEALNLEKQIKSWKSKTRIRKLINSEHPDA